MADRSLRSSIWAPGNRGSPTSVQRSGDWNCPSCRFSNYQWRKECLRCSTSKAPATNGDQPLTSFNTVQSKRNKTENIPPASKFHVGQESDVPHFSLPGSGLATSRWAPRGYSRGEGVQVWIRTVPTVNYTKAPSPSKKTTHNPVQLPDLGLPYQVQHFILAMIQRILEEGCYDFASRWLPQLLNEKGWDCWEAVELPTWKSFLPASLPPTAIKPLSNYTLEAALSDAVRIRNSAVHRHLCNNNELRRMTLQAQDLMSMFSDTTRQNKFHHLWAELNIWDSKSQVDAEKARSKLEGALQVINEIPIDDMDWTPNVVSLEELQPGAKLVQEIPVDYGDAMELD